MSPTPTSPPSEPLSAGSSGQQRRDLPYRWPRGPRVPQTPGERRLRYVWIGLSIAMSLVAVAAIWGMVATSW